jgi:hypothetical protein
MSTTYTEEINTCDVSNAQSEPQKQQPQPPREEKTAEEMKDIFLSMKGRPQPRAVMRQHVEVTQEKYFKVDDGKTLM